MANKAKSDILTDVRTLLDEQRNNNALISDGDTISVETDTLIWSFILQAVDEVHLQAQAWLVNDVLQRDNVSLTSMQPRTGQKGELPEDFLRMIRMYASDWMTPVYEAIDPDSEEYLQQQSRWKGTRGNKERPVVAVVPGDTTGNNKLSVEVWETEQSEAQLVYIKRAALSNDSDPEVTIAEHCYRPLIYTLAKHYLLAVGETERATICGATAGALLGANDITTETQSTNT